MKNGNFEIVKKEMYSNDYGIVLGHNPKSEITPWVTWEYEPKRENYFWGHYYSQLQDALIDFYKRILKNLEDYK